MASHQRRPTSVIEKATDFAIVLGIVLATLWTVPKTWWAVRGDSSWPLKRVLAASFLRNRVALIKRESFQALTPTTGETIASACKKRNLTLKSQTVVCGKHPDATLHEIQLEGPGSVLFYLHGGGYRNIIMGEGHVPVVLQCAAAAGASRIYFLEYGLTPGIVWPGQLYQAACALSLLLTERGHGPEQIILGGDSAGGNLALGLLAHVMQPHPEIPPVSGFQAGSKFQGVFLISPWVTLPTTADSFTENEDRDYISKEVMQMFVDFWQPRQSVWTDPLQAGTAFWGENAAIPAKRVFVSVGTFEGFRDDVQAMVTLLAENLQDKLAFFIAPGEIHVQSVVDTALGLPPAKSLVRLLEWFSNL